MSNWHRYQFYLNNILLPRSFYGKDGALKSNLVSPQLGKLYNEMWHAWWDQRLEEGDDCAWLYNIMKHLAQNEYGDGSDPLGMLEEAMSETAENAMLAAGNKSVGLAKRDPCYQEDRASPSHWAGEPADDRPISETAWDVLIHALENGCKPPRDGKGPVSDPNDVRGNLDRLRNSRSR